MSSTAQETPTAGRPVTNQTDTAVTVYPAADGGPPVHLIPRHKHRVVEHLTPSVPDAPASKWQAFGQAVLAFHFRVALTGMCRCGRTVVECDVLAQARQYGLVPPLP